METGVLRLDGLEEEARALAKSAYIAPSESREPPQLGLAFFKDFHETFFSASPESKSKSEPFSGEQQHRGRSS